MSEVSEYSAAVNAALGTLPEESAQDERDYRLLMGSVSESRPIAGHDLGLFAPKVPAVDLKHEKPEHRAMLYLKAAGRSNKEIAEITGYTPVAVSYIVNQPWAQKRIVELIHDNGLDAVQTLLQGAATDAVARLIREQDNMDACPRDRISAADKILDRVFGRPNQPMTHYKAEELENLTDEQLVNLGRTR